MRVVLPLGIFLAVFLALTVAMEDAPGVFAFGIPLVVAFAVGLAARRATTRTPR